MSGQSSIEIRQEIAADEKFPSRRRYDSLYRRSNDDDDESASTLLGGRWPSVSKYERRNEKTVLICTRFTLAIARISAIVYISISVHTIQKSIHLQPTGAELGDCDSSHTVAEARAKGCVFDPMSWLWVRLNAMIKR